MVTKYINVKYQHNVQDAFSFTNTNDNYIKYVIASKDFGLLSDEIDLKVVWFKSI